MNKLSKLLPRRNTRGDLLIEVMLAIAVIAIVLTGGYVLSHRGLDSSNNANRRSQAQALAQAQIERMVNTQNADPNNLSKYTLYDESTNTGVPFCILGNGVVDIDMNPATGACYNYENPIKVWNVYNPSTKTFTVTAKWGSEDTADNQVKLYYKLPVDFTGNEYVLNVYRRGNGGGKVTSNDTPQSINCGKICTRSFDSSKPPVTVVLTAKHGNDSKFVGWSCTSGTISGANNEICTITVDGLKYVAAQFKAINPPPPPPPTSSSSSSSSSGDGSGGECTSCCGVNNHGWTVAPTVGTMFLPKMFAFNALPEGGGDCDGEYNGPDCTQDPTGCPDGGGYCDVYNGDCGSPDCMKPPQGAVCD